MRKIILFAIAFAISSFVFSQENTVKKEKNNIKIATSVNKKTESKIDENTKRLASSKIKKAKYIEFSSEDFRTKNNIPSDFPKYKDNDNVVSDTKLYDISVKEWIKNNEEKYSEIKDIINF